ncbi:MAG TPA: MFS transporter [Candidatus Rifleibacterium sp.]|nr:MFS transporter [Candidatus Rifleibacterium sp.]HPT44628.1 MFS transporter [Candidatus Rifleibacterium sp.]
MNETDTRAVKPTSGNPWFFVPALFFLEGIPYFIVSTVSVTMFKRLGISNAEIGLWTSLITWPWIIKMLWGPLVESTSTKRRWIIGTQMLAIVAMLMVAATITSENFLTPTLIVLTLLAFLSATHDIAADGFYLLALSQEDQAYFVGIRSTAYRLANVFCNGGLIYLAGTFESAPGAVIPVAWRNVIIFAAGVYLLFVIIGNLAMPRPRQDAERRESFPFKAAFKEYFTQPKLHIVLGFILLYRFGESMVGKMSNPFLIDTLDKGGLGMTTTEVGFITGVVGVVALTLGGIIGGMVIAKFGIKRSLWPMVLAMNVPNLLYIWAATVQPGKAWVTLIIGCDQFGYGFGFAAYMVYLMFITQDSKYPTAHYAISTGLMAFGAMGAGITSGYVQQSTGYAGFFMATLIFAAPGIMLLPFLPLEKEDLHIAPVDVD